METPAEQEDMAPIPLAVNAEDEFCFVLHLQLFSSLLDLLISFYTIMNDYRSFVNHFSLRSNFQKPQKKAQSSSSALGQIDPMHIESGASPSRV